MNGFNMLFEAILLLLSGQMAAKDVCRLAHVSGKKL